MLLSYNHLTRYGKTFIELLVMLQATLFINLKLELNQNENIKEKHANVELVALTLIFHL